MSSSMMMHSTGFSSLGSPAMGAQSASPSAPPSWMMVPKCTLKVEKCQGGLKLHCKCDDEVACGTLQNLCKMLCAGMCSCVCTMNGVPCCSFNFCCGSCKCENTKDGVCITCTSGDKTCCEMLQACCDCLSCMCKSGCCCYVCFGSTPVCCCC